MVSPPPEKLFPEWYIYHSSEFLYTLTTYVHSYHYMVPFCFAHFKNLYELYHTI